MDYGATIIRKKKFNSDQKTESFCLALGYGIALHNNVPEGRRCVSLNARCLNDDSVPPLNQEEETGVSQS